jgi:hypothetical protein
MARAVHRPRGQAGPDAARPLVRRVRRAEEWFRNKDYHGCSFGRAATEFRDLKHAVHKMASEHKQQMLGYFRDLAAAAGAKDPKLLAQQIDLLVEGAIIHMEVFREPQVARIADDAAQKLVDAALS